MRKIKLLIVDDEIVVQRSCVDVFTEKSDRYDILTVSSGEQALKVMQGESFDIILTDLKMPGLSGLDLISSIKKHSPDTIVIVITGYSTVKTAVEAMKLGADDFLPKPFTADEVFSAVEKIADKVFGKE
jgi:DNA-binding NtrC family response regulator